MTSKNKIFVIDSKLKKLDLIKPIKNQEIISVQKSLDVILPNDFIELSLLCSYEFLGFFNYCNFGLDNEYSVINETKYYRDQYKLPRNYLIVSYDDVEYLLVQIVSSKKSRVIWCDSPDFFNLCDGKPFAYNPTIFESFTDFFEFLIDEEEKMRGEEEKAD